MSFLTELLKKKKAAMANRKPKDWRDKRRTKNKMRTESRRINRSR